MKNKQDSNFPRNGQVGHTRHEPQPANQTGSRGIRGPATAYLPVPGLQQDNLH